MKNKSEKMAQLSDIMGKVHALVDCAWPRDDSGVSPMPETALVLLCAIQEEAESR